MYINTSEIQSHNINSYKLFIQHIHLYITLEPLWFFGQHLLSSCQENNYYLQYHNSFINSVPFLILEIEAMHISYICYKNKLSTHWLTFFPLSNLMFRGQKICKFSKNKIIIHNFIIDLFILCLSLKLKYSPYNGHKNKLSIHLRILTRKNVFL